MAKMPKKTVKSMSSLSADEMIKNMRALLGGNEGACRPEVVSFTPKADIFMLGNTVTIEVEVPGVSPDDIELSFVKSNLFISGNKVEKRARQSGTYLCMERGFGKFYRSIELPFPIDTRKIKALYKNGILRVEAEKISDKRGKPKKIKITSG